MTRPMGAPTYTVATLDVTKDTYDEIRTKLVAAGYDHTLMADGSIDMTGIAITVPVAARYAFHGDGSFQYDGPETEAPQEHGQGGQHDESARLRVAAVDSGGQAVLAAFAMAGLAVVVAAWQTGQLTAAWQGIARWLWTLHGHLL